MILPASYSNGFAPRDGQPLYPELWRNCVGAWNPGLGPTGLTLRDWSGRGNHGSFSGITGAAWVQSNGKYALQFSSSSHFVNVGNNAVNQIAGAFSVAATVSSNAAFSYTGWIAANVDTASTSHGWEFGLFNGKWALYIFNGGTPGIEFTPTQSIGELVHVSASCSSAGMWLYVNGRQVASNTNAAAVVVGSTELYIGNRKRSANDHWQGNINSVQCWNKVLSPNQHAQLALRTGIAYELAPRRRSSVQVAAFNRRRRLLVGAGS